MKSTEKQELKLKLKRLGLFMLIVFLPILIVSILMVWGKVPQWLNILVLVILLFILYFLYAWFCSILDKKRQERLSKKKDPFSD